MLTFFVRLFYIAIVLLKFYGVCDGEFITISINDKHIHIYTYTQNLCKIG